MFASLVTTLFFAVTPVFAHRAAIWLGSTRANFWRLVVAAILLGGWAHLSGMGIGGPAFPWFVAGGVVGFGVGGLAMFQSLPRLGANLSTLIVQCGSAVAAGAVEWVWLGTKLSAVQLLFVALTVTGIVVGLWPGAVSRATTGGPLNAVRTAAPEVITRHEFRRGLGWAALSAAAQGAGAVMSRKAFAVAAAHHQVIDPGTAAYQRALGGVVIAALALAYVAARRTEPVRSTRSAWPWVMANAVTGPVLGVTSYQWALRTTPAGLVQPIVAAAPLLTIPIAAHVEQSRVRPVYLCGVGLAVVGVTGLLLAR